MRLKNLFLRLIKASRSSSSSIMVLPNPSVSYPTIQKDLLWSKETLKRILTENITPFWYPQVIDSEDVGHRLNHDIQGKREGRADKSLVNQARTAWFFSRLAKTESPRQMNILKQLKIAMNLCATECGIWSLAGFIGK